MLQMSFSATPLHTLRYQAQRQGTQHRLFLATEPETASNVNVSGFVPKPSVIAHIGDAVRIASPYLPGDGTEPMSYSLLYTT